jgi:hypothetical protein
MVRTYRHGVIVGEPDPPVGTLSDWLRSEIKHAEELIRTESARAAQKWSNAAYDLVNVTYLNGRVVALKETLRELEARNA